MDDADLDAPLFERRPLPNGFNPWDRAIVDRAVAARARWQQQLDEYGVQVECESCGKKWVVHPRVAAAGVFACSQACRDKAYRARKKNGPTRPLNPMAHRPWERRGKK